MACAGDVASSSLSARLFSGLTGFTGMSLCVRGNVRVAAAAREGGERNAMRIAFRTGGVAGMFTVGLGLFGAAVVVLIYRANAPEVLEGFGFGAALLAMFMRVGGGIYTKAADVGADLVGKVEQGIPEDDPRNAATIADNVGDNVGDCAGMAADLFESYSVMLVASLILGKTAFGDKGLIFPLIVPMIGVITAVIGIFAVAPRARDRSGMTAINRGFFISAAISVIGVAILCFTFLPSKFSSLVGVTDPAIAGYNGNPQWIAFGAVLIGIVLASAIQLLTGYFTETTRRPVRDIGQSSETGAATVILSGISSGMESAVYSALLIGGAVFGSYLLATGNATIALFAVAMAGGGLLTTVGVIVSMDSFGPVTDNAQGIAEMSGDVEGEAAQALTKLDAIGNTTKAITKGIAIATAVLAATALFGSFRDSVESALPAGAAGTFALDVAQPNVLVGLIIGASVVFLFSSLLIMAVGRAAQRVVLEVRMQFRTHPGIMTYEEKPDYSRVVDIVTQDSLRELVTPGILAVLTPIAVGFALRLRAARLVPGRRDRGGRADGGVPLQLRRGLGQRQEARRGRQPRRQGLGRARGDHRGRHRRRPVQGHRRPLDQPADQGHEPGLAADRDLGGEVQLQHRPARRRGARRGDHHRRGDRLLQAPLLRHGRRHPGQRRDQCRHVARGERQLSGGGGGTHGSDAAGHLGASRPLGRGSGPEWPRAKRVADGGRFLPRAAIRIIRLAERCGPLPVPGKGPQRFGHAQPGLPGSARTFV